MKYMAHSSMKTLPTVPENILNFMARSFLPGRLPMNRTGIQVRAGASGDGVRSTEADLPCPL
jgi:hypothetical protein